MFTTISLGPSIFYVSRHLPSICVYVRHLFLLLFPFTSICSFCFADVRLASDICTFIFNRYSLKSHLGCLYSLFSMLCNYQGIPQNPAIIFFKLDKYTFILCFSELRVLHHDVVELSTERQNIANAKRYIWNWIII